MKVTKTLTLQEAYFLDGYNGNLEELLKDTFRSLKSARERVYDSGLFSSQLYSQVVNKNSEGIFIRVTCFESGAVGVIDLDTEDIETVVEEFRHPKNSKFLRDESLFYVRGDKVLACNLVGAGGNFSDGVIALASKGCPEGGKIAFKLSNVPNTDAISRIRSVGVKSLDLQVTSYLVATPVEKTHGVGGIPQLLGSLFAEPLSDKQLLDRANLVASLHLKSSKLVTESLAKSQWLTQLGEALYDDYDASGFRLVLNDGSKMDQKSFRVSKAIRIPRVANTFCMDTASKALVAYSSELQSAGVLTRDPI